MGCSFGAAADRAVIWVVASETRTYTSSNGMYNALICASQSHLWVSHIPNDVNFVVGRLEI